MLTLEKNTLKVALPVLLVLSLTFVATIRVLRNPISRLPGPWYSKWTSLVLKWHWLRGRRAYYVQDLHIKYGPTVRLSPDEIDISDLASVKSVYNLKENFVKSRFYTDLNASEYETIFTAANVKYHRHIRKLLGSSMMESSIKKVEPTVISHFNLAIQRIGEEMHKRGAADVLKWWTFTATDIIGELSFGDSFRTLQTGKESEYTELLAKTASLAGIATTFPSLIPLISRIPVRYLKDQRTAFQKMNQVAEQSLDRYQRLLDSGSNEAQQTLFTKIMKAKDEGSVSHRELRDSAQAYIVAGSDTTANTLTYLVWAVCKHPWIKTELVKELQQLPDDFTDTDLRKIEILEHVISETLRLYAAAPSALPRTVPPGGAELGGFWVPGGTVVGAQAYTMHRKPEIFLRPEEFSPSRWSNATLQMKDAYMPYGRAARVCIGQHLANMELRHGAARFFRQFPNARISTMEGMSDEGMEPAIWFLITPRGHQCLITTGP